MVHIENCGSIIKELYMEFPISAGGPRAILSLKGTGNMAHGGRSIVGSGATQAGKQESKRGTFLKRIGIDSGRVHALKQVHSRTVFAVNTEIGRVDHRFEGDSCSDFNSGSSFNPDSGTRTKIREGDGLVTLDRQAVLSVTVADCLPVYLYDPERGAFGLVHSGWKGTGIAVEAATLMAHSFGTRMEKLHVLLGPCIGPCCYRVDQERYEYFKRNFGEQAVEKREKRFYINLKQANAALLSDRGVKRIFSVPDCTSCQSSLSSYRRDRGEFTLMLALLGYF